MSLILDALNRSRQETEQVPGLATQHFADGMASGAKRPPWLLRAVLVLALLVIGWLLLERWQQPEPATGVAPAPAQQPPAAASAPAPTQLPPTVPASTPTATAPPSVSAAAGQEGPVAEAIAEPVVTAPAQTAVPVPETEPVTEPAPADDSVAALYREPPQMAAAPAVKPQPARAGPNQPPSGQPGREEEALDIEQLVAMARDELQDARLTEHEVPFIAKLSQQSKDTIPTLFYQRHDYSGNPAQSTVTINGKALKKGASVAGVKVEEILPDSVVLNYQGTRFRLRALNSWVNL